MEEPNYDHKPKEIKTAKDLIDFVRGIPAKFWCADIRNDGNNHYCVLGHLDNAYGEDNYGTDRFTLKQLVAANNGTIGSNWYINRRQRGVKLTGIAIKNRVLKLLKTKAN